MAIKNRVLQEASAPGTGTTVNLAVATVTGFVSWASQFANGAAIYYVLDDGNQVETGFGVFNTGSPNTISRATVLWNSAGTQPSRLNFTTTTRVFAQVPAEYLGYRTTTGGFSLDAGVVGAPLWCGTAGGLVNAYTIFPTPAITAYVEGQRFRFVMPGATNTSTTPTLAISGLAARTLVRSNGTALSVGQLVAGERYEVEVGTTAIHLVSQPTGKINALPLGIGINGAVIAGSGGLAVASGSSANNETIAEFVNSAGFQIGAIRVGDGNGWNAGQSTFTLGNVGATGRSLNAAGTVNAGGADYAEYMTKAPDCGPLAKGAICGVTADGLLTDRFADAIAFVVKSTDPAYVGGDRWGVGLDPEAYERARARVDRIAFAGQVPVNVSRANPGDWILPVEGADGGIKGQPVADADLTAAQHRRAIGQVWRVLPDGRAWVAVRVA
jgi:hypothetical protein